MTLAVALLLLAAVVVLSAAYFYDAWEEFNKHDDW